MEVRQFNISDYNELVEWWSFWRFPAPTLNLLPVIDNDKINGIISNINGTNVACGFLYFTNSDICWIEFIVANPNVSKKDRSEGLNIMIEKLCEEAKLMGFKIVFSSIKQESLINRMKNLGFIEGTIGSTELVKVL